LRKLFQPRKNWNYALPILKSMRAILWFWKNGTKNKKEYTGRKAEVITTYILKTKGQTFWSPEEVEKYGFQIIQFEPKEK